MYKLALSSLNTFLTARSLAVITSPIFKSRVADNTEMVGGFCAAPRAFKAMNATRKIPTDTPSTTRFTPVEAIRLSMLFSPIVGFPGQIALFKRLPQGRGFFNDVFQL